MVLGEGKIQNVKYHIAKVREEQRDRFQTLFPGGLEQDVQL